MDEYNDRSFFASLALLFGMFCVRTRNCGHSIWLSIALNGIRFNCEEKNDDFSLQKQKEKKSVSDIIYINHAEQQQQRDSKKHTHIYLKLKAPRRKIETFLLLSDWLF